MTGHVVAGNDHYLRDRCMNQILHYPTQQQFPQHRWLAIMIRRLSATPCPTGDPSHHESRRDSILSVSNDTTANLDYTTEFKALFRNTKPRRRPTAISKSNGAALGFTIHEDEELKLEVVHKETHPTEVPLRRSVITQPAQRPKHRVSFVQPPQNESMAPGTSQSYLAIATAPRRLSVQPSKLRLSESVLEDETPPHVYSPKISKPARRGTIYIPTDDTTVPSMYMAIFSPLKSGIPGANQGDAPDVTGLAAQMARKKTSRRSTLAASPKRAPLLPHARPMQSNVFVEDRPGEGPGKENLPPGYPRTQTLASKKVRASISGAKNAHRQDSTEPGPSSRLFKPTASSRSRFKDQSKPPKPVSKHGWNSRPQVTKAQPTAVQPVRVPRKSLAPDSIKQTIAPIRVPTRFVVPDVPAISIRDQFPLLPEGVQDASMYEDKWLMQQEVAITQLVNSLFRAASPTFEEGQNDLLRVQLLELYGNPETCLLYKRLQGALLYGALSMSKEAVENGQRLRSDLGHQEAFINLWLETYDHEMLRTAFEVIVGRVISCKELKSATHRAPNLSTIDRRTLNRALETFLIRNEDSNPDPEADDNAAWCVRRTMLRSLMLIKLLDAVKANQGLPQTANLFQLGSVSKNSISVVQRLMRMISPSVGDPVRPLSHLGFSVSHCQYPLEEYDYEIRNLAVDLRDGVRITRLVELLLYRSASDNLGHNHDSDATTTLAMPTGEVLSLTEGHQDWPLSQHLKFPSLGRATRLFNNQIALGALQGVKSANALFQDINADDIVDGYREKTVRLLWALTSKWGLGGLMDWEDLKKEIRRLGRSRGKVGDWFTNALDIDEDNPGYMQYKSLLKEWVKAVASAHGLTLRNYTTSFADGRIFQAIVDEYKPFQTGFDSGDAKRSLASQLKSIGCSEQFVRLFEKTPGTVNEHVFDREFVMASLAFLCSRLLGPSKRARAAVVIQRGWRAHWSQVISERKDVLHDLAASCAARVQMSQRAAGEG